MKQIVVSQLTRLGQDSIHRFEWDDPAHLLFPGRFQELFEGREQNVQRSLSGNALLGRVFN